MYKGKMHSCYITGERNRERGREGERGRERKGERGREKEEEEDSQKKSDWRKIV